MKKKVPKNIKNPFKTDVKTVVLLVSCPDRSGIVAKISDFIYKYEGNIVELDQHTDSEAGLFLMRVEWQVKKDSLPCEDLRQKISKVLQSLHASWQLYSSDEETRIAVWVSRQDHCLLDLLSRARSGEFSGEIALVMSNHQDLAHVADYFKVPFVYVPVSEDTKISHEKVQAKLLREHKIDVVVLAKYMRIVSPNFITNFPQMINIHHSFLPAFPGANPYKQAHDRGVKTIGATAHYVTAELDAGPIIAQDTAPVSHRDSVEDLKRIGKDVERAVLSHAIRLHCAHRVLVYKNRTAVFE